MAVGNDVNITSLPQEHLVMSSRSSWTLAPVHTRVKDASAVTAEVVDVICSRGRGKTGSSYPSENLKVHEQTVDVKGLTFLREMVMVTLV